MIQLFFIGKLLKHLDFIYCTFTVQGSILMWAGQIWVQYS